MMGHMIYMYTCVPSLMHIHVHRGEQPDSTWLASLLLYIHVHVYIHVDHLVARSLLDTPDVSTYMYSLARSPIC